jgi:succinate dehydrogenase/fumarate reductase flavoprotein subunit
LSDFETLSTDVLVVGAGGAGMYAAISAARNDASVVLVDKNMMGRGGATIMAQMTVASALGHAEPDDWSVHLEDTIEAGRGVCNENLAEILCRKSPERILELAEWKVDWARETDGGIRQVMAPGHRRRRCCYVDFLATGVSVSAALRNRVSRAGQVRRLSNVTITDLVVHDNQVLGAVGFDVTTGMPVAIEARAVIIASGGLTRLYARSSASLNMAGESTALALRAGARLVDIEFVQFFPIGHLAPRLVGMDPVSWEPFRVKLGGRLLNGLKEDFVENYGSTDSGTYSTTRDQLTYAIFKEVEAGRGSPHGGAYLSFEHVPAERLRETIGPALETFARNGIDLTKAPVEVAPIAHYAMGGIEVDTDLATCVGGLYAAGEAVGGANGANRLSGNAIPEALVFGELAGKNAASDAQRRSGASDPAGFRAAVERIRAVPGRAPADALRTPGVRAKLQSLMWDNVGPFRTEAGLEAAVAEIRRLRAEDLPAIHVPAGMAFNTELVEWFELRGGLDTAEAIAVAALARKESRGAHQRMDFPETSADAAESQMIAQDGSHLVSSFVPVSGLAA